jgi:hypothetical protein
MVLDYNRPVLRKQKPVIFVEVSALSANDNSRYILEHILETLHLGLIRLDG